MKNQGKIDSPCEDTSVLAAEGEDEAKKRRKGIVGANRIIDERCWNADPSFFRLDVVDHANEKRVVAYIWAT
jgi:hypothetical protein